MRTNGHIHGKLILWRTGDSNTVGVRDLIAIVWLRGRFYMHYRPIEPRRSFRSNDLSCAYLRREITIAEKELRKRVERGAQRG